MPEFIRNRNVNAKRQWENFLCHTPHSSSYIVFGSGLIPIVRASSKPPSFLFWSLPIQLCLLPACKTISFCVCTTYIQCSNFSSDLALPGNENHNHTHTCNEKSHGCAGRKGKERGWIFCMWRRWGRCGGMNRSLVLCYCFCYDFAIVVVVFVLLHIC